MKKLALILATVGCLTLAASTARAHDHYRESPDFGPRFGLALTLGEEVYFIDQSVYRGPFSHEVVPSLRWRWFQLDLGLLLGLEGVKVGNTRVGDWSFSVRPGARLTPPGTPFYLRVAFPIARISERYVDWGMLFGVGLDIHLVSILGLVLEVDTTLSDQLRWGIDGVPLEFRAGISLHF